MSYTVPAGNLVALSFENPYTVPVGNVVEIPFADAVPIPSAANDSYSTLYEIEKDVAAPGFLANDVLNGGIASLLTTTSNGSLTFHADGSFEYIPNALFHGDDTFIYKLTNIWGISLGTVTITVAAPVPTVRYQYKNAGMAWTTGARRCLSRALPWGRSARRVHRTAFAWGHADKLTASVHWLWTVLPRIRARTTANWGHAPLTGISVNSPWRRVAKKTQRSTLPWGVQARKGKTAGLPWLHPNKLSIRVTTPWTTQPKHTVEVEAPWRNPHKRERYARLPWGHAPPLQWGVHDPGETPPPPVTPPVYVPPPGNRVEINFRCVDVVPPGNSVPVIFGPGACYYDFRPRSTVVVINTVSVVRLPERTVIPVSALSISTDADSLYWSLSGMELADPSFIGYLRKTVDGPKEIEVNVNGWIFIFIVETNDDDRSFNNRTVSVAGRSRTALLSPGFAPPRSYVETDDRLSVQLMDQELSTFYSEFTINHSELSWTVPAGAWFYDNLTPIEAINTVAQSSGSIVQSDPSLKELTVLPRYPVSPWDWDTTGADATILDDCVRRVTEDNKSLPVYNYVFVSGTTVGVGDPIVRDGTAGDIKKKMVTDSLITEHPVALERGRNELSDHGEQAVFTLDLPLFAPDSGLSPGLLLVGKLVNYVTAEETWKGLNVKTSIDVSTDQDGLLQVWMTVGLERHYSDEG